MPINNPDQTLRNYYDALRDTYVRYCKEKSVLDVKEKIGDKFNSILIILFLLTFSQIIPLWIFNSLPESLQHISVRGTNINNVIIINIAILLVLKIAYHLNTKKLVFVRAYEKKKKKLLTPLQKSFMAIYSCFSKLKSYLETQDENQLKEAKKHYNNFHFTLPYEIFFDNKDLEDNRFLRLNSILSETYRKNHLPWIELTPEQISDTKKISNFFQRLCYRIDWEIGIEDVLPALNSLALSYYSCIKAENDFLLYFSQFKRASESIRDVEIEKDKHKLELKLANGKKILQNLLEF